jgi:hypothetical protein
MQRLLLTLVFLITITFASCFSLFDDPHTTFVKEQPNPSKTKKAVLLENAGNATVDFSLQVSILDYDYVLSGKELGNVFVVDRDHGATGLTPASINFEWISNDTLQIDYDQKLRTFSQEKNVDGIIIIYKPR